MRSSYMLTGQRGMTLIESSIVLAVVSIVTAAMAPAIRGYVQQTQLTAAQRDAEMIGAALARFLADVGEAWVIDSGAQTGTVTAHAAPLHSTVKRVDLLVSDGNEPVLYATRSGPGNDWNDNVDGDAIQILDWFLVLNTPGNDDPIDAFRTPFAMDGVGNFDPDSGRQYNSVYGWRGPYVTGPISSDPWGNRYGVNVEFLARTPNSVGSGSVNDVFVLSAGSNGLIETRFDTDGGLSPGDVTYLVATGTR